LLKGGIIGFLLYIALVISAIFKALNNSESYFMKYLGLLLAGYVLMFFIENIIAFNLFNVTVWLIVGMCHSRELRKLSDKEIKDLFQNIKPKEVSK
jgi:O-antigen ligase